MEPSVNTPMQYLNNLCIEFSFSKPNYIVDETIITTELNTKRSIFRAKCQIQKDDLINVTGGDAFTIKEAKHSAAAKMIKEVNNKFELLERTNEDGKIRVVKWTNSCERCYSRYHTAFECTNTLRNKRLDD